MVRSFIANARGVAALLVGMVLVTGDCASAQEDEIPAMAHIPAGWFWQGSDSFERQYAYQIDEQAYGQDFSRRNRWYETEIEKWHVHLPAYAISQTLITNAQYAAFIADTGHPAPSINQGDWERQGLIYSFDTVQPYIWNDGVLPKGREEHPVVLISWHDANAYVAWLTEKTGRQWSLPSELFWEKAVRGPDGTFFPWGNIFDPELLNSGDHGPFDTTPVTQFAPGPFGLYDGVGQVYEWTGKSEQAGYRIVKGGSWDDRGCGICRPAARHARPEHLKHFLIGFRVMYRE
ncbi:formylglycine-generating enzyme family protein [Thalassospira sp. MA62]|nr:formylglycine-generating enzyme family protein [Thalassospira sp. MA62]